ncbi:MAG: flagellar protein FlaG [Lachnospiraceae bacterium]|nr:flagellar protein FlaG [Lachnospiraceae bacterium]
MAIEAINNAMSLQSQIANPVKAPVPVKTDQNVNVQAADIVDTTTKVVENTQNKGQGNATDQNEEQGQTASSEQIRKAVESFNKNKATNSEAIFGIHDGTNRVTIKIVDKKTKEVIKELPPEKTLDMIAKVWEMAGILVDEKR